MRIEYHGYPEPTLPTSEIMRALADDRFIYAQMEGTFEPFLFDTESKTRYAVPHEVDGLIEMISSENRKERYKRMAAA
jgi:hypothetical protein